MYYFVVILSFFVLLGCGGSDSTTSLADDSIDVVGDTVTLSEINVTTENIDLVSNANNDFAFDIYHNMSVDSENHFFSSYSTYTMLNVLLSGAQGATQEEMLTAGNVTMDLQDWENSFNALHAKTIKFLDTNNSSFTFSFANSFWVQTGVNVNQEYIDKVEQMYGIDVQMVDFVKDSESARATINNWTSDQTNSHIENILDENSVNEDSKIILVNAMYLKALWSKSFFYNETKPSAFFLSDGSHVSVPMMHQVNKFRYVDKDGVQVVCMHYKDSEFGLVSFLPQKDRFDSFEASLSNDILDYYASDFDELKLDLYYPKFEIKSEVNNLKELLMDKGMVTAFSESADFSGINENMDVMLSEIAQKIYFKIDEEGTEAASSTAIAVGETSAKETTVVKFDRPFIVMICHIPTRTVLFMGKVLNPLQ